MGSGLGKRQPKIKIKIIHILLIYEKKIQKSGLVEGGFLESGKKFCPGKTKF